MYGNEAEIGKALRDAIRDGEVTRKDQWITSKLWSNAHTALRPRATEKSR